MNLAPVRAAQRSARVVVSLLSSVAVAMTMVQLAADQDAATRASRTTADAPGDGVPGLTTPGSR